MEICPSHHAWPKLASQKTAEHLVKPILRQLIETMSFLHTLGIYHRDLKVFNLLVDERPEGHILKLIDFGVAALSNDVHTDTLSSQGFTSPEQFEHQPHTPLETEAWQFGVFTFIVVYDEFPFGSRLLS